jgi:HAD superfamily hydrolase (TIGR01484 family)
MYTKFSDLKNVLFTTKRVKRTYIHLKLFMKMKIVDFTNPINALKINLVFLSQKKKQLFLDFIAKNNISQKLDLAIHKNLIEITNVNVNKGFSVQTILEKEEYKNSQTAAIGDSDNDIPMFKKVNLSFSISKKDSIKKQSLINFKKQKNAIDAAILNYLVPDAK